MQSTIQLQGGEDTTITIENPVGLSYCLRANQRPGHPGESHPTVFVEDCFNNGSSNLALFLPLDEADAFVAEHCDIVIGSYDPNDKRGWPLAG